MSDFEDLVVIETGFNHCTMNDDAYPKLLKAMEPTGSIGPIEKKEEKEPSNVPELPNPAPLAEKPGKPASVEDVPEKEPPPPPPVEPQPILDPVNPVRHAQYHHFEYDRNGHQSALCSEPPPPPAPINPQTDNIFLPHLAKTKQKKPAPAQLGAYYPPPPPCGWMPPPVPPPGPPIHESILTIPPPIKPRRGRRSRSSSISSNHSISTVSSRPRARSISPEDSITAGIKHCNALLPFRTLQDRDHVVRLTSFSSQEVFVQYHNATTFDFNEYSWIIRHGLPGRWFYPPDPDQSNKIQNLQNAGLFPIQLNIVEGARPARMRMPRIWMSKALTEKVSANDDSDYEGEQTFGGPDLVYYLVLHAEQSHPLRTPGPPIEGQSIYKVLRCGCREAALSEAYYQAGNFGLSTVFCCAFREGADVMKAKMFRRVQHVENLGMPAKIQDRVKIFY